jgi:hypothetical protein
MNWQGCGRKQLDSVYKILPPSVLQETEENHENTLAIFFDVEVNGESLSSLTFKAQKHFLF